MSAYFDEEYYLSRNPDVAYGVQVGLYKDGLEHYVWHGHREARPARQPVGPALHRVSRTHRAEGTEVLFGAGLELGPLALPCPVPAGCNVTYCDRLERERLALCFPAVLGPEAPPIEYQLDLNTDGLSRFSDASQDFVIANNVLQQVGNPLRCLEEMFRVTRPGGFVVLSVPDKRFSPDGPRSLTSWDHVLGDYLKKVSIPADEHYIDIIGLFFVADPLSGIGVIEERIARLREEVYAVHVWDTETFRELMARGLATLDISATLVFEALGDETCTEYFATYRKTG